MTELLFDLLKTRASWIIRMECMEFKFYTGLKDFRLSDKKDAILSNEVTIRSVSRFNVDKVGNDTVIHLGHGLQIVSV